VSADESPQGPSEETCITYAALPPSTVMLGEVGPLMASRLSVTCRNALYGARA
jgi:hypothetical protein